MKNSLLFWGITTALLLVTAADAQMKCGAGKCGAAMMQGEKAKKEHKSQGDAHKAQAAKDASEKNRHKKSAKDASKMKCGAK